MMRRVHIAVWLRLRSPADYIKSTTATSAALVSMHSVCMAPFATAASRRSIATRFMHRYRRKRVQQMRAGRRRHPRFIAAIQLLPVRCSSLHKNRGKVPRSSAKVMQPGQHTRGETAPPTCTIGTRFIQRKFDI